MAGLMVTALALGVQDGKRGSAIPSFPPAFEAEVAVGAGSVASAEITGNYDFVRLCSTVACRFEVAAAPVALNATAAISTYLPADTIMDIDVPKGSKIAAIQAAP